MIKLFLIFLILLTGCFFESDKEDPAPSILAGTYFRSEVLENIPTTFYFDLKATGEVILRVYSEGVLLTTSTGTWSQSPDKLCIKLGSIDDCDMIRNITATQFELFDTDSNSWVIFSKQ